MESDMPDRCSLWVNLASAGPRRHPHAEPTSYLHFHNTGLMVGLPDEPGVLIDENQPLRLALDETDAAGLGLTAEDFARGVAFCNGNEGEAGWQCGPVELLVNDEEGEIHAGAPELPATLAAPWAG